jgi:hypothetical protein
MPIKRRKGKKSGRPDPEDPALMHPTPKPSGSDQSGSPGALLESYKKHVEELRGIEDRQNKAIALLLGIFSAAGTLLIKEATDLGYAPKVYVTLLALVVVGIGQHAINELHDMRTAVRDLLVRCEIALGFYEPGAFLVGKPLYTNYELKYPTRGNWMKQNYWIVWSVSLGFLVLLWLRKHIVDFV